MALVPKALVPRGSGMAVSPEPEARGRAPAGGHPGMFVPWFGPVHVPAVPSSLCCARCPPLPVPTSIRAGPAEELCTTLPETGAPGTAPGPGPCTPAGKSPVVRAGSARGTRPGCSCKHSPASGTPGSPLQQRTAAAPPCLRQNWRAQVVPQGRRGHQCPKSGSSSSGTFQEQCQKPHQAGCWNPPLTPHCPAAPGVQLHPSPS